MKISVVIPIYNVSQYVGKCIQSLLCQTYRDFELILVDDDSPDDSVIVAKDIVATQNEISYRIIRHEKNKGLSGARNTGLLNAQCDLICFVDSDDYVSDNYLAKLVEPFAKYENVDIAVCRYEKCSFDNSRQLVQDKFFLSGIQTRDNALTYVLEWKEKAYTWKHLFRKSLFDNDNLFPEGLVFEDVLTLPLLYNNAREIFYVDECLYQYVIRENSITTGRLKVNNFLGTPDRILHVRHVLLNKIDKQDRLYDFVFLYDFRSCKILLENILFESSLSYNELKPVIHLFQKHMDLKMFIFFVRKLKVRSFLFIIFVKLFPKRIWSESQKRTAKSF